MGYRRSHIAFSFHLRESGLLISGIHQFYYRIVELVIIEHSASSCMVKQLKRRNSSNRCNAGVNEYSSRIILGQACRSRFTNLNELVVVDRDVIHTDAVKQIPKIPDRELRAE